MRGSTRPKGERVSYEVMNVSKGTIHENLDTQDDNGKIEVFSLAPRAKTTLTDDQFASRRIQRHVLKKRLRARKVAAPATK